MHHPPYFLLLAIVVLITTVSAFALYRFALAQSDPPLSAQFFDEFGNPQYHQGASSSSWIIITFDQPVADFNSDTPSVTVEGGVINYFTSVSVDNADGETQVFYVFLIEASGEEPVTFTLRPNQPCADGGICTAGGTMLTGVPDPHVILGPIEVSFGAATLGSVVKLSRHSGERTSPRT
ncbi:MAG: hypothetical protein OXL37_02225 [Chloroflexota bacterium]|nr:hypothetical protein [Chloroflexota bacterium]MDE2959929.1 hypothetical protein [Chloroflexota bacterium]